MARNQGVEGCLQGGPIDVMVKVEAKRNGIGSRCGLHLLGKPHAALFGCGRVGCARPVPVSCGVGRLSQAQDVG